MAWRSILASLSGSGTTLGRLFGIAQLCRHHPVDLLPLPRQGLPRLDYQHREGLLSRRLVGAVDAPGFFVQLVYTVFAEHSKPSLRNFLSRSICCFSLAQFTMIRNCSGKGCSAFSCFFSRLLA